MMYLGFTCGIFLLAGLMAAAFVSIDDFEGRWVCVGTMTDERFVPYPPGIISNEIRIRDDRAEYWLNGDQMTATYGRHRLRVELAAQICMEYRLTMEEGRMIVTDQHGIRSVYEKIEEDEVEK